MSHIFHLYSFPWGSKVSTNAVLKIRSLCNWTIRYIYFLGCSKRKSYHGLLLPTCLSRDTGKKHRPKAFVLQECYILINAKGLGIILSNSDSDSHPYCWLLFTIVCRLILFKDKVTNPKILGKACAFVLLLLDPLLLLVMHKWKLAQR